MCLRIHLRSTWNHYDWSLISWFYFECEEIVHHAKTIMLGKLSTFNLIRKNHNARRDAVKMTLASYIFVLHKSSRVEHLCILCMDDRCECYAKFWTMHNRPWIERHRESWRANEANGEAINRSLNKHTPQHFQPASIQPIWVSKINVMTYSTSTPLPIPFSMLINSKKKYSMAHQLRIRDS